MTRETKELYCLLLCGTYIRRRMNLSGVSEVVAYEGNQVPVRSFPAFAGDELKSLLKVDRKDKFKFTLNLKLVRQLDGRSWYKKTFNEHLQKQKALL